MNILLSVNNKETSILLKAGEELVIGRERGDFGIQEQEVSRNHLKIKLENGIVRIWDESTNGTFINNSRLTPRQWIVLNKNQHVLLTADGRITLKIADENAHEKNNTYSLYKWLTKQNRVVIGRADDCDIVLPDPQISRRHASIEKIGNTYFVTDHSLNGTYLNGKKVLKKTELKSDEVLTIGLFQFSMNQAIQHLEKEQAIQMNEVSFAFPNGVIGIHKVSLSIQKEKMVALMGPSGCGKSTLLQLLNGIYKPATGSVDIFGLSLQNHFELLKQFIGYVPQDNIVHEDLTINQALFFTAKLRLGQNVNQDELNERIDQVLENLNINEPSLRNQAIKTLSGGQKKRVSIAVELLTRPKILFLDEPTSPLDPETIEEFLKSLRNLCNLGTTVVLVTHKPEDLAFMDEVVFMGKGGHLVYQGNKTELARHFECERLPQVYHKFSDKQISKRYYNLFNQKSAPSSKVRTSKSVPLDSNSTDYFHQFVWLFLRYLKLKVNNKQNLLIAFSQPIIVAFLTFLVFPYLVKEDDNGISLGNMGVLFITALTIIWFGISNSAKEIVSEKVIFKREHLFNIGIIPYLLSKAAVLFLLTFCQTLLFFMLVKIGFPELAHFELHILFTGILGFSAVCFGLALSAWSKTTEAVMTMLPVVLIPQIVLEGIIHPLENKTTEWLSYLSLGRWGTEGIARIQDRASTLENPPFLMILENNLYQNNEALQVASMKGNALILMLLSMIFLLATYLKLEKKHA